MTHVLLWSFTQNAVHIEPTAEMLSNNRRAYCDDRASDYIVLAIGTDTEVHDAALACFNTLAVRERRASMACDSTENRRQRSGA